MVDTYMYGTDSMSSWCW